MNTNDNYSVKYLEVNENKKINYFQIFRKVLGYWKILLVTTVLGIGIAFIYNKLANPVYRISTTVLFRDQESELSGTPESMPGLELFTSNRNFYNEITVINSYPIVLGALSNLNFEISYFTKEGLTDKEMYQTSPFVVVFNQGHPQPVFLKFELTILDDSTYRIKAKGKEVSIYSFKESKVVEIKNKIRISETAQFGKEIGSDYYRFKIIPNKNISTKELRKNKYYFVINNLHALASSYKTMLNISLYSEQSTVATISLLTPNTSKAIDFLNSLTDEYIKDNLQKKNHMARSTVNYINGQLQQISDSLSFAEEKLQDFRTQHQVINVDVKAEQIYTQLQTLQAEKAELTISEKYYQYIKDHFDSNKDVADLIAPSSMGIEDPLLGNLVQEFIELNSEKNTLLENNQQRSPYLRRLEIQIENLKNTIYENIKYHLNTVDISLKDINQRIANLNSELNKLPSTERQLLGIERDFNLNDAIYTFLLQRRAEAQIAMASNLPNTEIIEPPRVIGDGPVMPRKRINYILGLLLGMLLPGSVIIMRELIRNVIISKDEIQQITNVPVLGYVLTKPRGKKDNVVFTDPDLPVVESFRRIVANLPYFSKGAGQQVIMVTSSISGEGKSFCAYNLASIMALKGIKTVLTAFDMRKSEFYENLNLDCKQGISSVLTNQAGLNDALSESQNENLFIISPGPVPPNPAELIASAETEKLIEELKRSFEMIIIDTPPIGILADAIHILGLADIKIFISRINYTPKGIFINTIDELENKKLKNLTILINDYKEAGGRYSYHYKYYRSHGKRSSLLQNYRKSKSKKKS